MNDFPLNLLMGVIAGFSVSVPLGPGGLFCIQRTLSKGPRSGLVAGMGAATSDVIYASLAILSLSFIRTFIENNKNLIFLVSGMGLMIIGLAIFSSNPVKQLRQNRESKNSGKITLRDFSCPSQIPDVFSLLSGYLPSWEQV